MYQIGEFSKIVGITVKALRYYDEIDLLLPAQINEDNGYRYYDDLSYQKAMWIQSLKRFNFSVKEMQEVITNVRSDDDLADYLLEKQEHINSFNI
jgi:DNA-binding transcriptional MerR regulator